MALGRLSFLFPLVATGLSAQNAVPFFTREGQGPSAINRYKPWLNLSFVPWRWHVAYSYRWQALRI